ncbi:MAG: hypothetical protein NZL83_03575 [Candidatus Absconditabacterales bacterium]|nr:hypothetical protein [Candidatus Absconditabacterales bacterium]
MLPPMRYLPAAISTTDNRHKSLKNEPIRSHYPIRLFGKTLMHPELVSFAADAGYRYTYSQTTLIGTGRPTILLPLKQFIHRIYSLSPTSVLCNRYRDENDRHGTTCRGRT